MNSLLNEGKFCTVRQGQSMGVQCLIILLNSVSEFKLLISIRTNSHIFIPRKASEFSP